MNNLPSGWAEANLGDVVELRGEKCTPSSVPHKSFIGLEDIEPHTSRLLRIGKASEVRSSVTVFKEGDVLYSRLRPYLNKVVVAPFEGVASAEILALVPNGATTSEFVRRQIMAQEFLDFTALLDKGDRPRVNFKDIAAFPVALPPLTEQKRVVTKIDSLSDRIARTRTALESIPVLVEKYKDAVVNAAFASLNLSVPLLALVDQDRGIPYGIVQTGKHQIDGIPTVRAGDIKGFCLLEDGLKRVSPSIAAQYGRTVLHGGEVLIAIRGSVGETCVVPASMRGSNISREVALIPVADCTNPSFIMYFLKSSRAAAFIKSNTKGIAQTGINLRDLKKLPSPNIPVAEQLKVVERIETAFSWLDRVSADYTAVTKLLPKLDAAILSKAFRGGLVTQDPNDEPASTLLTRIHVERAAAPKKPRQRRTKDKKMTRDPKERLLKDSETWPENGLPFEQVSKRNSIPYDDMRDVIFALLSGPKPILRQVFDKNAECMHLQRIKA